METHIVWYIKSRTRCFIYLSSIDSFSENSVRICATNLKIGMLVFRDINEPNEGHLHFLFFLCSLKLSFINFIGCFMRLGMQIAFLVHIKTTNLKSKLWNQHPIQSRLVRASQALIWNFPVCISDMVQNQFGLFLFSKTTAM